jgi:hypothetical protein
MSPQFVTGSYILHTKLQAKKSRYRAVTAEKVVLTINRYTIQRQRERIKNTNKSN